MVHGIVFTTLIMINQSLSHHPALLSPHTRRTLSMKTIDQALLSPFSPPKKNIIHMYSPLKKTPLGLPHYPVITGGRDPRLIHGGTFSAISPQSQLRKLLWCHRMKRVTQESRIYYKSKYVCIYIHICIYIHVYIYIHI